jgi:hypothetical protein
MSDRPVTKSASAETSKPPSASEESSSRKPVPLPHGSEASRWLTYAALAIALVATVLAALAYFLPAHHQASVPQQGGDAKANVCSAYKGAHTSVVVNTHMQSRNPNDAVAELSVATNARLALIGGGAYLKDRLASNTAAPADLANAVNSFANTIEQLGTNYLIGVGTEVQDPLRKDLDSEVAQIDKLCA